MSNYAFDPLCFCATTKKLQNRWEHNRKITQQRYAAILSGQTVLTASWRNQHSLNDRELHGMSANHEPSLLQESTGWRERDHLKMTNNKTNVVYAEWLTEELAGLVNPIARPPRARRKLEQLVPEIRRQEKRPSLIVIIIMTHDFIPRFWSNLTYLGQLLCKSSDGRLPCKPSRKKIFFFVYFFYCKTNLRRLIWKSSRYNKILIF